MKQRLLTLFTLVLCVCSGAWATGETYTIAFDNAGTQNRSDGKTENYFTQVGTSYNSSYACTYNGVSYSKPLKMESATTISFTSTAKATVTIVMSTARSGEESNYPKFDGTALTKDQGTANTNDKNYEFVLTEVAAGSHSITRSSQCGLVYVGVVYTEETGKTTLTGAWSSASPSFAVGSSPTIPTFSVTGGGTLGTDYTVAYTKTDESGIVTLTDGTGAISSINTTATATATVTATVTVVNTTDYEMATTSYDCAISVIEATQYATPIITEKNGTVQITSTDDILVSQIKYSLDNGETWNDYTIPFNLSTSTTVKAKVAVGTDPAYTESEIATAECNAIPAAADGSMSITLYNDESNWTKSASQSGSSTKDTWTGKAGSYLEGWVIALNNEGQTGSSIKELATGNSINSKSTIKGSNGRTLTFTLPTGVKVNRITVYSYTNGDDDNKYLSTWKFNGETVDMIGLSLRNIDANSGKSVSSPSNPDVRVFSFATPLENSFTFVNTGYQQCFYMVLDYIETVSATISSSGYTSLSSSYALDFSGVEDLTAFVVTKATSDGVTLSSVEEAPAETGLVLKGTAGETYSIPVVASASNPATNLLSAVLEDKTVENDEAYILKGGKFCLLTDATNEAARTIPAGKAYLPAVNVTTGKGALTFAFEDEAATGIVNANADENRNADGYYNLAGQRVSQPVKGLYIKDGKKYIVK